MLYLCIFSLFFEEGRSDLASMIFRLLKPEVIFDVLLFINLVFSSLCSLQTATALHREAKKIIYSHSMLGNVYVRPSYTVVLIYVYRSDFNIDIRHDCTV